MIVSRNHRLTVTTSTDRKHWKLTIRDVRPTDQGWYMCQISTDPMLSQMGHLEVTGERAEILQRWNFTQIFRVIIKKEYTPPTGKINKIENNAKYGRDETAFHEGRLTADMPVGLPVGLHIQAIFDCCEQSLTRLFHLPSIHPSTHPSILPGKLFKRSKKSNLNFQLKIFRANLHNFQFQTYITEKFTIF